MSVGTTIFNAQPPANASGAPSRRQEYADAQGKLWAVASVTELGSPDYFLVRLHPAIGRSSPLYLSSAEFRAMTSNGSLVPAGA